MRSEILSGGAIKPLFASFPCLGWVPDDKLVVLFSARGVGTVIHYQNSSHHTLGQFSKDWQMDCFKPFTNATVQIGE